MNDRNLLDHINQYAREEHELFEREAHGKISDADSQRLKHLQTMLDQCWDLLRQRRAKREFGQDPNDAQMRDERVVKNYVG
jgi:hypothetical protein